MRTLGIVGVLGLIAFQLFGAQASWAQAAPDRSGSPRPGSQYTLFVELHRPYESSRAALKKMLKEEGHETFDEREQEISVVLTAAQIGKLFQAKVRLRKVEASASSGAITQPSLEGARIPARFEKLIRRVYFDPQRG
jgi:hypothetical protein